MVYYMKATAKDVICKVLACIFLITSFLVVVKKIKSSFPQESNITAYEDSNYVRNILIGCLNVVFSCIIYMLILIYCNVKLMLLFMSITNEKRLNHFMLFESLQSKIISLLLNKYTYHFHNMTNKNSTTKLQHTTNEDIYTKLLESLKIVNSFHYHVKFCK
ncbi:hypothetical protein HL033_02005 [Neoehrlichia mikurensis]|uniref:Uncharacterized protein n=1 Tax=Neoehrlichia mikurensis TaxID=89586 RepID=A0A9Q9BUA9_9RICK|nr:hypothetical protein [Neoehrlichia mikurensis]QXK92305.1 hypothetical protein IAH97_02000 [Neoehrlichia mikurensis]QXK92759.1 hypothetical protein HUN61_01995 [Neoehrlichia mikurensis]QXK94000.1 hypothetical protein HL033_02005 [Neoehrlichia mikurensis]UTO55837.1 hypothetical protein LUA82_02110 [Neoehrlichia mikurensis]UTO56752.1 hypothetical protein LUA81_02090 [Neoehrlichia mikurensis]